MELKFHTKETEMMNKNNINYRWYLLNNIIINNENDLYLFKIRYYFFLKKIIINFKVKFFNK
jgi:hypothetical protein